LYEGVVYCTDHLGVIAAVEAATGRPVWVRRAPVPALGGVTMTEASNAYQWPLPIAVGPSLYVLTPDRAEVLRIDRATGNILARRSAADLGQPSYLLRIGDRIAAVASDLVSFVPLADFDRAAVHKTRAIPAPGIRGRAVVSGDR